MHSRSSLIELAVGQLRKAPAILGASCIIYFCIASVSIAQEQPNTEAFSHLLVERLVQGEAGHLVSEPCYLKLPKAESSESERQLASPSEHHAHVLAVTHHAVYFSIRGNNIERVSLRDPTDRTFFPGADDIAQVFAFSPLGAQFYAAPTAGNLIYVFDVARQSRELVVDRSDVVAGFLGGTRNADLALSPDGKLLATATYIRGQLYPEFAIEVFETSPLASPKLKFSKVLPGELLSTGAGFPLAAPAMIWINSNDLLLLVPQSSAPERPWDNALDERDQRSRVLDFNSDKSTYSVLQLSVDEKELETVIELHLTEPLGSLYGPSFWKVANQRLMLESQSGRWELDIPTGTAIQTRMISPDYAFKGDGRFPSLWYRDRELAAKVNPAFVSLSPDGRQIAWCEPVNPQQILGFQSLQFEQVVNHHSAETGSTRVTEGIFSNGRSSFRVSHPTSRDWLHWVPSF